MGINTLEQDDNKVKSCGEKGKVVEREELLLQLTIHTVKEMSSKTLV
jgi:phosphotransferase system IIA component